MNRKQKILSVVGVIVGFPALFLGAHLIGKYRVERRIENELSAIRKAAQPLTANDLAKLYPKIPDAENSALIYLQASSNLVGGEIADFYDTDSPLLWIFTNRAPLAPIPPGTKDAMRQWFGSNAVALKLIHEAAQLPRGAYPFDLSRGLLNADAPLPRPELSKLITWSAVLAAEDNDGDTASRFLTDSFGLPRSLKDHPYELAQAIRESCLYDSVSALQRVLGLPRLNDRQLTGLQHDFHESAAVDWMRWSLLEERCSLIEYYDALPKASVRQVFTARKADREYALWDLLLYRERAYASGMGIMGQYIKTCDLPMSGRLKAQIRMFEDQKEAFREIGGKFGPFAGNWAVYTSRSLETRTRTQLAEIALAVERYELAHEDIAPVGLESLVPTYFDKTPTNPFDGQPIKFTSNKNGFRLAAYTLNVRADNRTNIEEITFTVENSQSR